MEYIRNKFTEERKKMYRIEGMLCQQITIMRKAMTNDTCFAHNFLKAVLVRN